MWLDAHTHFMQITDFCKHCPSHRRHTLTHTPMIRHSISSKWKIMMIYFLWLAFAPLICGRALSLSLSHSGTYQLSLFVVWDENSLIPNSNQIDWYFPLCRCWQTKRFPYEYKFFGCIGVCVPHGCNIHTDTRTPFALSYALCTCDECEHGTWSFDRHQQNIFQNVMPHHTWIYCTRVSHTYTKKRMGRLCRFSFVYPPLFGLFTHTAGSRLKHCVVVHFVLSAMRNISMVILCQKPEFSETLSNYPQPAAFT